MMRPTPVARLWLLLLSLWLSAPLWAATENALLWRLEHDGEHAGYLFGTIHSGDQRVLALPDEVTAALDESSHFVSEMEMDMATLQQLANKMVYTDGRTLRDTIGDELYQRVAEAMAARGIPEFGIKYLKPWAVLATLSMPEDFKGDRFLDLDLYQRASGAGKRTFGLESPEEQLQALQGDSIEVMKVAISDTLRQQDQIEALLEQMTVAWLARDLREIERITKEVIEDSEDPELAAAYLNTLLDARNIRMAIRLRTILAEGDAFIAVGAAHLPGEQGLLQLLGEFGYQASPVY